MKTIPWILLLLAGIALSEESDDIDLPARRQSVVTMREHLAMREARLQEVAEDLRQRGEQIDKRIGGIVDSLAGLKDSESSRMQVSRIKVDAAKRLRKMIDFYQAERRKLVERAKKDGGAPLEGIAKDVAVIDAKVEARAAAIVKLVESIPGEKDVAKYESDGTGYYDGWVWENTRISEEWRQNRRDKVQSQKARREAGQALEAAIADLEKRRDATRGRIRSGGLTEVQLQIEEHELGYLERLLAVRREQLMDVSTSGNEPEQTASADEAHQMKLLFEDAAEQLGEDFNDAIRLYRRAAAERDKLHALRENLKAREEWLAKNDPDWKG